MWKELNKSQIPSLTYTSPHPSKCEETKLILYIMIWLPDGGCGVNTLLLTVWILDISARSWDSNIWHNNFVQIMSFWLVCYGQFPMNFPPLSPSALSLTHILFIPAHSPSYLPIPTPHPSLSILIPTHPSSSLLIPYILYVILPSSVPVAVPVKFNWSEIA